MEQVVPALIVAVFSAWLGGCWFVAHKYPNAYRFLAIRFGAMLGLILGFGLSWNAGISAAHTAIVFSGLSDAARVRAWAAVDASAWPIEGLVIVFGMFAYVALLVGLPAALKKLETHHSKKGGQEDAQTKRQHIPRES